MNKEDELLRRYQAGERDFPGVNLESAVIKNADLSNAYFDHSTIGNCNLTGANLSMVSALQSSLDKYRRDLS